MSSRSQFAAHASSHSFLNSFQRAPPVHRLSYRFYSSIPSQRSRVFARQEERLPRVNQLHNSSITRVPPATRQSEIVRIGE